MNDAIVTSSGSRFHVVDQGEGPPLLLVHGFPLDHTMWRFQIQSLSARYRVICPDLPGFGKSLPAEDQMSMKSFADELADLLERMNVNEPITFCGLSMGGYIGWQFWKHHRNRLACLVACDTRAAADSESVARARHVAAKNVLDQGSQSVAETMIGKLIHQPDDPDKRPIGEQTYAVISRTDPNSIAQGQLAMAERPDATPWLNEIKLPTLFVVGEHDEITPPTEMRENAALVSRSEFLEVPNAGHLSPLENPEAFNRGLLKFLDKHT